MDHKTIREKFRKFFEAKEHTWVPSSSLLPDDPSVLFTTAGMQRFKKYYTGELDAKKDFKLVNGEPAKGTASIQKCIRTSDINEVGDESHLTFFEMLGNFSFGEYGKKEAIQLAYDFLTLPQDRGGLGIQGIEYVTFFSGDKQRSIDPDFDSQKIWKDIQEKDKKIGKIEADGFESNFWGPTGNEGPCGPTTEIYLRTPGDKNVEVWNIVFNEFYRDVKGNYSKLPTLGIDTGMGLERLTMVVQKKENIFETDLFVEAFGPAAVTPGGVHERYTRVFLDHLRAVIFLIADGFRPSNKDAGYVVRRLIRRLIVAIKKEGLSTGIVLSVLNRITPGVIKFYSSVSGYEYLLTKEAEILEVLRGECDRFSKTLDVAMREFYRKYPELGMAQRIEPGKPIHVHTPVRISGDDAFYFHQSYGLTIDIIKDLARDGLHVVDEDGFQQKFREHQEKSRAGAEKKFGGHGLVLNTGELKATNEEELKKVTRLHTATHLLHQALRNVLGKSVHQAGSDITVERTRFDFTFDRKLTDEEKKKIEDVVNDVVTKDLPVNKVVMPKSEAEKTGALFYFSARGGSALGGKEKYPDPVNIYFVGNSLETAWSKEFCGGPHVTHTGEIGKFKIIKEEAVSAGVRRIRATVE